MASQGPSEYGDEAAEVPARAQTRRALLGKAAFAGGGFGLAALARPEEAQTDVLSSITERTLALATSMGATTITLAQAPIPPSPELGFVCIGAFTSKAEIRLATAISGTVVTLSTGYFGDEPAAGGASGLNNPHPVGTRVLFFQGTRVPASWFGASGAGSGTDDYEALQAGLREVAYSAGGLARGLIFDGEGKQYRISKPLILPQVGFEQIALMPHSSYAPVDTSPANAMVMASNLPPLKCSANPLLDTIRTHQPDGITLTAHRLWGTAPVVVFQGSAPAPLVAGRLYFARDLTTNDSQAFKVAATPGGPAINLTSKGSVWVHRMVLGLQKVYVRNLYISGSNVTNMNGMFASLQQPTYLENVRIDNCPGTALTIDGQQAHFTNLEFINNGIAIRLENFSFGYFYGLNIEQLRANGKGIYVPRAASRILPSTVGVGEGAANNVFFGVHLENMNNGVTIFDFAASSAIGNDWINVEVSANERASPGQKIWHFHLGNAENSLYTIRDVRFIVSGSGLIAIQDDDRAHTLDAYDVFHKCITEFLAPYKSQSTGSDGRQVQIIKPGGGYVAWGGQQVDQPQQITRPGAAQTGHQAVYRDASGNDKSGVNKGAYPWVGLNSAPADADIAPGRAFFWFDPTNGAAKVKFKGKQSDGRVVSGEVPLR
jgi:hypothetical protein